MGVLVRYREYLPITTNTPEVDLHEGSTPLVASRHIASLARTEAAVLQVRGTQPDGLVQGPRDGRAVAKAAEDGSKVLMCASTGNTSASMAAYAASAGIRGDSCRPGRSKLP